MKGHCELCQEDIESGGIEEVLDHIRVMHPDEYGDGPPRWPDGGLVIDTSELPPEAFMGEETP